MVAMMKMMEPPSTGEDCSDPLKQQRMGILNYTDTDAGEVPTQLRHRHIGERS